MHVFPWIKANQWIINNGVIDDVVLQLGFRSWNRWWNNIAKVVAVLITNSTVAGETFLALLVAVGSRLFSLFTTCRIESTLSTNGLLPACLPVFIVINTLPPVVVVFSTMVVIDIVFIFIIIGRHYLLFGQFSYIIVQFIITVNHFTYSLEELFFFYSWFELSGIILVFILLCFKVGFKSIWAQNPIVVCWISRILWIRLVMLFRLTNEGSKRSFIQSVDRVFVDGSYRVIW